MNTEIEDRVRLSVWHESVEPFAYAQGEELVVRLRIAAGAAKRVRVVHCDKFAPERTRSTAAAERFAQDGPLHEVYQARLSRASKRFKYYFRVDLGPSVLFVSRRGATSEEPGWDEAFEVPHLGERDRFQPPSWAEGALYYQVFPDRFYRPADAVADGPLAPWDSVPTPSARFGGTIRGIADKLGHLVELGVEVLYLTPVFEAPSNHKYDTSDYLRVDPDFGTDADLRELVEACHAKGIRVVLDAVFNHMGARHPFFLDLLQNGPASPYRDFVHARSWPLSLERRNYETFGETASMPKWRTASPGAEEYLLGVGEHWLRTADIDGWRLDVADEVEHRFWKHFRDRVKSVKPDALICGEVWQVAAPWLRGDEFDAVMNYPLGRAVLDWIARGKTDARGFCDAVERIRSLYPEPVLHTLWTLLDSHDTPRLLTECGDDVEKAMLAAFLQFTLPGAPLIYYGDEVGMTGGSDPLCRGGMVWETARQDSSLLAHYRVLSDLRRSHGSLRKGDLRPVFEDRHRHLYAFLRIARGEPAALALVNGRRRALRVKLRDRRLPKGSYRSVYGGDGGRVFATGETIQVEGLSALLLIQDR